MTTICTAETTLKSRYPAPMFFTAKEEENTRHQHQLCLQSASRAAPEDQSRACLMHMAESYVHARNRYLDFYILNCWIEK